MQKRIRIHETDPGAYRYVASLDRYISTGKIPPIQVELIKLRASQINGCEYCIGIHRKDAISHGETEERIAALADWRQSHLFSEEERVILALTEEVTNISGRVSDATYEDAATLFDEQTLAQIIMAIVAINSFNRIAITTELE